MSALPIQSLAPKQLLDLVQGIIASAAPEGQTRTHPGITLIHLTLRQQRRQFDRRWVAGDSLRDCLSRGLRDQSQTAMTIEVTLPHSWAALDPRLLSLQSANDFRGFFGLEVRAGQTLRRIGPLEMLARNLEPGAALKDLLAEVAATSPERAEVWQFATEQFLIDLPRAQCFKLYRGQRLVRQSAITRSAVHHIADGMTHWLAAQVGGDGHTTYKYWPSSGHYSEANNMIRQFMGSACLALAARRHDDEAIAAACGRNLAHNFAKFYVQQDGFGFIDEFGTVKLGAAAVALMAVLNLADRTPFAAQLAGLTAFVLRMQKPDGSFRTFHLPADRNENQNFYPGEALLALAMLHHEAPDDGLLHRIMVGFRYYRDWHRDNRNPAFVPWHTQAYCLLLQTRPDPELADFVFQMNDWLMGLQEGGDRPDDVQGDFFDPVRPEYGPPHASATGVYLEGLIAAWQLARGLNDAPRQLAYRQAILRGLRSLRQLQFKTPVDMFYIRQPSRVLGAVRTSTYDNTVRIDNVQHGLMAIYSILDRFSDADFAVVD